MNPSPSQQLRSEILTLRDRLSKDEILSRSAAITRHFISLPLYRRKQEIMLYISYRSEVCTWKLLQRILSDKGYLYAPVTKIDEKRLEIYRVEDADQLIPGAYGILEPNPARCQRVDPAILDLIAVPGSVFSRECGRYGYGGGYYDRFLSMEAPQAVRIALAFSFQVKETIPLAPHDELMDYIITENEIISCGNRITKRTGNCHEKGNEI